MFRYLLYILLLSCFALDISAQNVPIQFGRNRVQFKEFSWQYYKGDRIDTYFYLGGMDLGIFTIEHSQRILEEIEAQFQFKYKKKISVLVFNEANDIYQTNLGYRSGIASNQYLSSSSIKTEKGKLFVHFDGNHDHLLQQIRKGIMHIILSAMMNNGSFTEMVQNSVMMYFPEWYYNGLLNYYSEGINSKELEQLRVLLSTTKKLTFSRLIQKNPDLIGKALWYYIDSKYSGKVVSNMIYMSKINRNIEYGFVYLLGKPSQYIYSDCINYFHTQLLKKNVGVAFTQIDTSKRIIKNRFEIFGINTNSDNTKTAYVRSQYGRYQLRVFDHESGKTKTVYRDGFRTADRRLDDQKILFDWIPGQNKLTTITEVKDEIWFIHHDFETGEKEKVPLKKFQKVHSFSYAPNGKEIYLSASQKGQSDLYRMKVLTQQLTPLTNDKYDDLNPIFVHNQNQKGVYFLSNRTLEKDALVNWSNLKVCFYDFNNRKKRIIILGNATQKAVDLHLYNNELLVQSKMSNRNNLYKTEWDTVFVKYDTIFYFADSMVMNPKNAIDYEYAPKKYGVEEMELIEINRPIIKLTEHTHLNFNPHSYDLEGTTLTYARQEKRGLRLYSTPNLDTWTDIKLNPLVEFIEKTKEKKKEEKKRKDSITYKIIPFYLYYDNDIEEEKKATTGKKLLTQRNQKQKGFSKSKILPYRETMYIEDASYKLDNSTILTPYSLQGSNTGLQPMYNASITDLFEDYRLQGGFKAPLDFRSKEYYLMYENNKKRFDKKFIYYRRSDLEIDVQRQINTIGLDQFPTNKMITNLAELQLRYPFNIGSSIVLSTTVKQDKKYARATEPFSLFQTFPEQYWSYGRLEYIYDNSIQIAHNARSGIRFKAFYEYQKLWNDGNVFTNIVGADWRGHARIHRQITFNTRLAAGRSFGNMNIAYVLGGVDSWLFPTRDSVGRSPNYNFIQEAHVTHLRGFDQNVRNGNKYAVWNTEFRIPIVQYLALPWYKEFWQKLEFIGFADVATAWVGSSPTDNENPFKTKTYETGPVKVITHYEVDPILKSFGWGVRTHLMGYYVKIDFAWPHYNGIFHKRRIQLSTILDF